MSKSTLAMPTRSGWRVEWETGKVNEVRRFRNSPVKLVPEIETYYTTDKTAAQRKAEEMKHAGFKGVIIRDCIF